MSRRAHSSIPNHLTHLYTAKPLAVMLIASKGSSNRLRSQPLQQLSPQRRRLQQPRPQRTILHLRDPDPRLVSLVLQLRDRRTIPVLRSGRRRDLSLRRLHLDRHQRRPMRDACKRELQRSRRRQWPHERVAQCAIRACCSAHCLPNRQPVAQLPHAAGLSNRQQQSSHRRRRLLVHGGVQRGPQRDQRGRHDPGQHRVPRVLRRLLDGVLADTRLRRRLVRGQRALLPHEHGWLPLHQRQCDRWPTHRCAAEHWWIEYQHGWLQHRQQHARRHQQ